MGKGVAGCTLHACSGGREWEWGRDAGGGRAHRYSRGGRDTTEQEELALCCMMCGWRAATPSRLHAEAVVVVGG